MKHNRCDYSRTFTRSVETKTHDPKSKATLPSRVHFNKKLTNKIGNKPSCLLSNNAAILPATRPPKYRHRTEVSDMNMNLVRPENFLDKRLQCRSSFSGVCKTQTVDSFISTLDNQLNTEMNTIHFELSRLRRKSIDLLTNPEEHLRSGKTFPEVEQEICD